MTARRTLAACVIAICLGIALWFFWPRHAPRASGAASAPSTATTPPPGAPPARLAAADDRPIEGESRIADALNAPGGDIRADLRILNEVFETWQTNFAQTGNPVGENAEITAALTGENLHRFAFIPRGHRAINARGELTDRWGTPFRFHQISGQQMEIRSAGPDRNFLTDDDAFWPPR
ncbi:MAG: hypothetical protein Q8N18_17185 [Opitutaceae bacterium]|nr:hypothetical protein [Opitutaceae bacterium]